MNTTRLAPIPAAGAGSINGSPNTFDPHIKVVISPAMIAGGPAYDDTLRFNDLPHSNEIHKGGRIDGAQREYVKMSKSKILGKHNATIIPPIPMIIVIDFDHFNIIVSFAAGLINFL